jgi:hypothetical protein
MSAIGTKRTSFFAPHMSAFGGKADIDPAADQMRMVPVCWLRGSIATRSGRAIVARRTNPSRKEPSMKSDLVLFAALTPATWFIALLIGLLFGWSI